MLAAVVYGAIIALICFTFGYIMLGKGETYVSELEGSASVFVR